MPDRQRLDQILIEMGLLTDEQVRHTLARQKTHGGKFGTHLLYNRYVTEESLVEALAIQFNCQGVMIADRDISQAVLDFIPYRVAQGRGAIPFDYIPDEKLLKIAVANPEQPNLIEELSFIVRGKKIELHVASEIAIDTAIRRLYCGEESSIDDSMMLRIPSDLTDVGENSFDIEAEDNKGIESSSRVVVVTNEPFAAPMLKSLVECDGPHVELVESLEEAVEIVQQRFVQAVLIRESLCDDHAAAEATVRGYNFRTEVLWFSNASQLALGGSRSAKPDTLKTVELLVSLLASNSGEHETRAVIVGRYVSRICNKLGLPAVTRQKIVLAAFLHNLSQFSDTRVSKSDDSGSNRQKLMKATADLLETIGFSSDLVDILRSAYVDLQPPATGPLPLSSLGGNILTAADLYSEDFASEERITLMKFEEIKRRFYDLTGKLFLPEVVDALILALQEECLTHELTESRGEAVFYHHNTATVDPFISYQLSSRGIRVTNSLNLNDLKQVILRRSPDLLMVLLPADNDDPLQVVTDLTSAGVDISKIPVMIITDADLGKHLDKLFSAGISDVASVSENSDILATKAITLIERNRRKNRSTHETEANSAAAHGSLANINLIDLIQALGPGRKTVRITLQEKNQTLIIYLVEGSIVHASLGDITGPEAIFEGISWVDGSFMVTNVKKEAVPLANTDLPNESILMEGCRLMDERVREEHL